MASIQELNKLFRKLNKIFNKSLYLNKIFSYNKYIKLNKIFNKGGANKK